MNDKIITGNFIYRCRKFDDGTAACWELDTTFDVYQDVRFRYLFTFLSQLFQVTHYASCVDGCFKLVQEDEKSRVKSFTYGRNTYKYFNQHSDIENRVYDHLVPFEPVVHVPLFGRLSLQSPIFAPENRHAPRLRPKRKPRPDVKLDGK